MPKLIDYPRTSYPGAWEIAEVVDDTGGKCALETCARKLNRKVSGSFKAIVGSAVKFGLLTSKREMLTTTTLFRRIKHAYDKQEELLFHREAFLTPPLFTQLCRKFRSRELPVAMLDVLLIREFDVEEINAQNVAKSFVDGARMVGLLNEQNILADIDQLNANRPPRRELANPLPTGNAFRQLPNATASETETDDADTAVTENSGSEAIQPEASTPPEVAPASTGGRSAAGLPLPAARTAPAAVTDAIASLFNLSPTPGLNQLGVPSSNLIASQPLQPATPPAYPAEPDELPKRSQPLLFQLQLTGPGINTSMEVADVEDLLLVRALLDKLERQLKRS